MLDETTRRSLEAKLEQMRQDIVDGGDVPIAPNRGDLSTRTDEDAQPLNEMHQAVASRRNQVRTGSLGKILSALQRLHDTPDEFGLCLECEEEITPRRLELIPYAELCVDCQSHREPTRGGPRRKITDYVE